MWTLTRKILRLFALVLRQSENFFDDKFPTGKFWPKILWFSMVKTAFFQLKILWKTINYLRPIFQTIWRCSDSWTTLTLLPDQTESGPRSTQITEYWRYWLRTMLGDFRSDCRAESGRMLQLHRAAFSSTLVLEIGCDFLLFRLRPHVEKFSELWDEHRDTFLLECGSWEPADLSVDICPVEF